MSIKNQNYAHEKVWHLTFFSVIFLFEFIDQKFEFFKGGGGGSWPLSCISAHVYNYISIEFFFFQSSKGDKGGSGGADGTLEDLAEESFSECLAQTELRSNSAYCLLNGFGEKRIRFFYFLVPVFVLVFRIKTLQIKYNLFRLNLGELHWMETPIVVKGRCLKDLTGSWVGKIFVLAFKLSRRKYIFTVYEWVLIQYLP